MHTRQEKTDAFVRLLDIVDLLRIQCPWDAKQTNETLRPNTVEEVFELSQALLDNNQEEIKKELGDVLLHVLFYSKIGSEKRNFDIKDVCDAISDKLIYRHPHVFGDTSVQSSEEVERNWEELKLKEKGKRSGVMNGVPSALPSLIKACRIQEKAANVGFDWKKKEQVWEKVEEELAEVRTEVSTASSTESLEEEIGDLLFSVVNAARLYSVDPDTALERTNRKFLDRFTYIERKASEQGKTVKELTLDQMDFYWNEAKRKTCLD